MSDPNELSNAFIAVCRHNLSDEMWPRLCTTLDGLTEEQIWWRPNEQCNSIGNLLLHLNGNMRQWILGTIGGVENERDRDAEFAAREGVAKSELRGRLEETLRSVDALLARLGPEDLARRYEIQVYKNVTALEAIFHVVEHFAMHYGQMLYIAKMLTQKDLGFYAHLRGGAQTRN